MKITPLGKFLRKLRIDLSEDQATMADKIGYTPQYLSMVEIGTRSPSIYFVKSIIRVYNSNPDEVWTVADLSTNRFTIRSATSDLQKTVAGLMSRNIHKLSAKKLQQIREILEQ